MQHSSVTRKTAEGSLVNEISKATNTKSG